MSNFSLPPPPPPSPPLGDYNANEVDLGWSSPNIPAAIIVSIGAGLATSIGGAMVFFPEFLKRVPQNVILGVALAVSAGVMLYVSFIEIFAKALASIEEDGSFSSGQATGLTTLMFFLGMFCCVLLEVAVVKMQGGHNHDGCPAHTDPKQLEAMATSTTSAESAGTAPQQVAVEIQKAGEGRWDDGKVIDEAEKKRLTQMGVMTAAAIAIHNFPEGARAPAYPARWQRRRHRRRWRRRWRRWRRWRKSPVRRVADLLTPKRSVCAHSAYLAPL